MAGEIPLRVSIGRHGCEEEGKSVHALMRTQIPLSVFRESFKRLPAKETMISCLQWAHISRQEIGVCPISSSCLSPH